MESMTTRDVSPARHGQGANAAAHIAASMKAVILNHKLPARRSPAL
jgi:hypothetical protein